LVARKENTPTRVPFPNLIGGGLEILSPHLSIG
jgi:hypothetical protein